MTGTRSDHAATCHVSNAKSHERAEFFVVKSCCFAGRSSRDHAARAAMALTIDETRESVEINRCVVIVDEGRCQCAKAASQ